MKAFKSWGQAHSGRKDWSTPQKVYRELDTEFHFADDPCPLHGAEGLIDGLSREWKSPVFMNPPYGPGDLTRWMRRAYEEGQRGSTVVCLVPARTDCFWWHEYALKAAEIRFVRGRLCFNDGKKQHHSLV